MKIKYVLLLAAFMATLHQNCLANDLVSIDLEPPYGETVALPKKMVKLISILWKNIQNEANRPTHISIVRLAPPADSSVIEPQSPTEANSEVSSTTEYSLLLEPQSSTEVLSEVSSTTEQTEIMSIDWRTNDHNYRPKLKRKKMPLLLSTFNETKTTKETPTRFTLFYNLAENTSNSSLKVMKNLHADDFLNDNVLNVTILVSRLSSPEQNEDSYLYLPNDFSEFDLKLDKKPSNILTHSDDSPSSADPSDNSFSNSNEQQYSEDDFHSAHEPTTIPSGAENVFNDTPQKSKSLSPENHEDDGNTSEPHTLTSDQFNDGMLNTPSILNPSKNNQHVDDDYSIHTPTSMPSSHDEHSPSSDQLSTNETQSSKNQEKDQHSNNHESSSNHETLSESEPEFYIQDENRAISSPLPNVTNPVPDSPNSNPPGSVPPISTTEKTTEINSVYKYPAYSSGFPLPPKISVPQPPSTIPSPFPSPSLYPPVCLPALPPNCHYYWPPYGLALSKKHNGC